MGLPTLVASRAGHAVSRKLTLLARLVGEPLELEFERAHQPASAAANIGGAPKLGRIWQRDARYLQLIEKSKTL